MSTIKPKISVSNLNVFYGSKQAIFDINMSINSKEVTAFIGPSGCGKSTLLRCFNRMNEALPSKGIFNDFMITY